MKLGPYRASVSGQSSDSPRTETLGSDEALLSSLERLLSETGTLESQALLESVIAAIECDSELSELELSSMQLLDRFAKDRLH